MKLLKKVVAQYFDFVMAYMFVYEGDSICNDSTNALEFYTIYGTKYHGLTFRMVHKT